MKVRDDEYTGLQRRTMELWQRMEAETPAVAQIKEQAAKDGIDVRPLTSQQMLSAIDTVLSQQCPSMAGALSPP